jgi:hypothetical protein
MEKAQRATATCPYPDDTFIQQESTGRQLTHRIFSRVAPTERGFPHQTHRGGVAIAVRSRARNGRSGEVVAYYLARRVAMSRNIHVEDLPPIHAHRQRRHHLMTFAACTLGFGRHASRDLPTAAEDHQDHHGRIDIRQAADGFIGDDLGANLLIFSAQRPTTVGSGMMDPGRVCRE